MKAWKKNDRFFQLQFLYYPSLLSPAIFGLFTFAFQASHIPIVSTSHISRAGNLLLGPQRIIGLFLEGMQRIARRTKPTLRSINNLTIIEKLWTCSEKWRGQHGLTHSGQLRLDQLQRRLCRQFARRGLMLQEGRRAGNSRRTTDGSQIKSSERTVPGWVFTEWVYDNSIANRRSPLRKSKNRTEKPKNGKRSKPRNASQPTHGDAPSTSDGDGTMERL